MARTWLINDRGIARKVKNANRFSNYQIKELGIEAHRECPNCKHVIDNSDVSLEWPGFPAGVKFGPTDIELLEHLAGKVGLPNSKAHLFIDEFIPTLEDEQGICFAHPKNLPGAMQDGSSVHFFHRISNAYSTGHRKRRKIGECNSMSEERMRWHKTGKTKPVMENGVQNGWKKIMVLYRSLKKGCKPVKTNWRMHQYHLGIAEEEKDGELVVSKIFYIQNLKQIDKGDGEQVVDSDASNVGTGPRTPKTVTSEPPRPDKQSSLAEAHENRSQIFLTQKEPSQEFELPHLVDQQKDDGVTSPRLEGESQAVDEFDPNAMDEAFLCHEVLDSFEFELPHLVDQQKDDGVTSPWLAGESQAVDEFDPNTMDEALLCHEVLDSFAPTYEPFVCLANSDLDHERNDMLDRNLNAAPLFADLDNIPFDAPPDFQLADLQFGSQDSISSWLDRL